jgi:hypothetical protein
VGWRRWRIIAITNRWTGIAALDKIKWTADRGDLVSSVVPHRLVVRASNSWLTPMQDISEFEKSIYSALTSAGCDGYSVADLRRDIRECRNDIYADTLKHGGDLAEPFVEFIIVRDVAIFTFFDSEFSLYVFPCVEAELISQTNPLAMSDVSEHRQLLRDVYGKNAPDAVVSRAQAELWLG